MTREEALKKAINIVAYFEAHFAKSKEAREDAANIIEVLEQTRWIPVSEGEYPEAYTEVLVYDNSDYFIAWWTGIRGRWNSYNSNFDINTPIVAWMPIEPYKASPTGEEVEE